MPSPLLVRLDQRVDRLLDVVRAHRMRVAAAVVLTALFFVSVARNGLPLDRAHLLFWLTAGMVVATASRFGGWVRGLLRDWLPLLLVLLAYDWLRGYADRLGTQVHYAPQLPFDRWLSGGQSVSVRLQHLWWAGHPWALDYVVMAIYLTHFVVTPTIAAWLWVRNRVLYREFAARLVTLFVAGLVTFALYPAAPPWMAGQLGRTAPVENLVTVSLTSLAGVHTGTTVTYDVQGHGLYNPVAALPSLHAALPMLVLLVFYRRSRRWVRVLLVVYTAAMGFTLVYTGAHFVLDVLLGWAYAVAVVLLATWVTRARARRAGRPTPTTSTPPESTPDPVAPSMPAAAGRPAEH